MINQSYRMNPLPYIIMTSFRRMGRMIESRMRHVNDTREIMSASDTDMLTINLQVMFKVFIIVKV